jgi:undecaprenyl-diphosphatase
VCVALFALLAVAVEAGWTQALDVRLMVAAGRERSDWATTLMRAVSAVGAGKVEIPLALLLSLRLSMIRRRSEAAGYAAATLSGWALYGVAKWSFHRPRPRIIPRLSDAGWFSFPSGHATMAPLVFGLGLLIWSSPRPRGTRLAMLALAGAASVLIACSRVYLGVHWPSDVVGGLLAGTGWGAMWVWWWELAGTAQGRLEVSRGGAEPGR